MPLIPAAAAAAAAAEQAAGGGMRDTGEGMRNSCVNVKTQLVPVLTSATTPMKSPATPANRVAGVAGGSAMAGAIAEAAHSQATPAPRRGGESVASNKAEEEEVSLECLATQMHVSVDTRLADMWLRYTAWY